MVYRRSDLASGRAIVIGEMPGLETHSVERKLAAIFAADVEGYSRLMGLDEVGTLRTLTAYRVIIDRLIASHRGRILNAAGDSLVDDFVSAVDAVQCAVAVQDAIAAQNEDRLPVSGCGSTSASTSTTSSFRVTTCSVMPSLSPLGWRLLRSRAGFASRVPCRDHIGTSWLSSSSNYVNFWSTDNSTTKLKN
jgi:hypothetical protein